MGRVRAWDFDAVIGVGGIGSESSSHGLDGKLNWIGIGPRKYQAQRGRGPIVSFDRFVLFEKTRARLRVTGAQARSKAVRKECAGTASRRRRI
jgi:hypothetical protein